MERIACTPRPHWQARVEHLGLVWHGADAQPYWDESACYRFSPDEIAGLHSDGAIAGPDN